MPTVRTTMQPDKEIEVNDVEYRSLKRQGLLVDDTPAPALAAPPTPSTKKTTGGTASKETDK